MPYPSQIDRETIIETAHTLIDEQGVDAVSLRVLADELGVKAPSLYRYVKNKTALLLGVNEVTFKGLMSAAYAPIDERDDTGASVIETIVAVARAYRAYAHAHPVTYELLYTNTLPELSPPPDVREQGVLPLQALFIELCGSEADSLPALRGAFAMLHGWIMLEITDQLRRGGDLNAHFEQALRGYLAGWATP